jgi:hypothetical protein
MEKKKHLEEGVLWPPEDLPFDNLEGGLQPFNLLRTFRVVFY